jgi:histidine ammonia-lyase
MENGGCIFLDGKTLSVAKLMLLDDLTTRVELTAEAWELVRKGREVVDNIVKGDKKVYGINTGFGSFANVKIERFKLPPN